MDCYDKTIDMIVYRYGQIYCNYSWLLQLTSVDYSFINYDPPESFRTIAISWQTFIYR